MLQPIRTLDNHDIWWTCNGSVPAGLGRAVVQRRWASDDKKSPEGDRPFYLQLQESIYERVQKEKGEQYKIQSLQQRTARGQFFATVFGNLRQYLILEETMLMQSSMPGDCWSWILLWPTTQSCQTRIEFDRAARIVRPAEA